MAKFNYIDVMRSKGIQKEDLPSRTQRFIDKYERLKNSDNPDEQELDDLNDIIIDDIVVKIVEKEQPKASNKAKQTAIDKLHSFFFG
jgi:hypothetical protein